MNHQDAQVRNRAICQAFTGGNERALAEQFGLSYGMIRYVLLKNGFPGKSPGPGTPPRSDRNEAIITGILAGRSIVELAEEHGVSKQRVHQIVKGAGLSRRSIMRGGK